MYFSYCFSLIAFLSLSLLSISWVLSGLLFILTSYSGTFSRVGIVKIPFTDFKFSSMNFLILPTLIFFYRRIYTSSYTSRTLKVHKYHVHSFSGWSILSHRNKRRRISYIDFDSLKKCT